MAGTKWEPNTSALVVPDAISPSKNSPAHLTGVRPVGELALLGQGASLQPVQQRHAQPADRADLREVHVRVDEAGDQQPAVEPSDRLVGVLGPQRREAAPGADDALPHQQRADLGQRVAWIPRERVTRCIDDRPGGVVKVSFTGRMGTTLGEQWVPPERLRRGLFDHSRDQGSSPAGLATTS